MNSGSPSKPLYENLDTAFVNLWSLLRNLTARNFVGRVRVELEDYSADIFMSGSAAPLVHEIDRAAGTESTEEAALHRVVLRARETPGTISVFEGAGESAAPVATKPIDAAPPPPVMVETNSTVTKGTEEAPVTDRDDHSAPELPPAFSFAPPAKSDSYELTEAVYPTGSFPDWSSILATTGELMGAIERGIDATGDDFDSLFRAVCLELADDYTFLDPTARTFEYSNGVATLNGQLPVTDFVAGLSLALRRTIDRVAVGERSRRVRERIALELVRVTRKRRDVLERSGFQAQLDRIVGTRVM